LDCEELDAHDRRVHAALLLVSGFAVAILFLSVIEAILP